MRDTVLGESLGKITLGQKADQLASLIGKPDSKGKDSMWEAVGIDVSLRAEEARVHYAAVRSGE